MPKSLKWYLSRHSLLYKIRFKLVSKSTTFDQIEDFCYNSQNPNENIPVLYSQINNLIFPDRKLVLDDFKKGKKIAKWLAENIKGGPGLGISSELALKKMIKGEGGVCSDFSQIYNNFCVINNLKVKEWGLKIEDKNNNLLGGHSFNEIYCTDLDKWILIDVSKSIYFYHKSPKLPLSVEEFYTLKNNTQTINYEVFNKKASPDHKKINDHYFGYDSYPFVITNYCNKTFDFFLGKLNFLPVSVIHGLVFLIGKGYTYQFPNCNTEHTKV